MKLTRKQEAILQRLQEGMRRVISEEIERESEGAPDPGQEIGAAPNSQGEVYHTFPVPTSLILTTPQEAVAELQEALWEWIRELANPVVYDLMFCHDALGAIIDRLYPPQSRESVETLQRDLQTEMSNGLALLAQLGQQQTT